jgi:protein KTI12
MESALEVNKRLGRYDESMLENLCSRFEEPDGRNRWDAPLYTLIKSDESLESSQTARDILLSLTKKAPNPNLSTVVKPIFDTDYLAKTDKCLGDIIDCLIDAQKNQRSGDIIVPNASKCVCLPSRFISLSEFRRLKRQYLHLNKSHTIFDIGAIGNAFTDYINNNFADSDD